MTEIKALEDLLPLGTVAAVSIADIVVPAMIIGYCPKAGKEQNIWDYLGVPYPGGLEESHVVVFENTSIRKVILRGYSDEESENARAQMMLLRNLAQHNR